MFFQNKISQAFCVYMTDQGHQRRKISVGKNWNQYPQPAEETIEGPCGPTVPGLGRTLACDSGP